MIDLLQRVLIDYYALLYTKDWTSITFNRAALWVKVVTVLIVLLISWVIQAVVQDFIVAKIYGYFLSQRSKINRI